MNNKLINHFLQVGIYTNPSIFKEFFKTLPDDIYELRDLINFQHIHKMTLFRSFNGENNNKINLHYKWTNYRCLDDVLLTAPAMIAEIFRLNNNNLCTSNDPNKKLIITCRYVCVLFASVLKAKNIPCRCRSGFAPYLYNDKIVDHWIVQYWDKNFNKWINVDAQANLKHAKFNIRNFSNEHFCWAADTWLKMRKSELENKELYCNGTKHIGDLTFALSLMMDFHALFHDEINYITTPVFLENAKNDLSNIKKSTLKELDNLAKLMLNVDDNFEELQYIWENNKKFRSVSSGLNRSWLHLELDKKDFS